MHWLCFQSDFDSPRQRAGSSQNGAQLCTQKRKIRVTFRLWFQNEAWCKAFDMKICFIHTQIFIHLHVNKTNFHVKGFII